MKLIHLFYSLVKNRQALRSPVKFTIVLVMSRTLSSPKSNITATGGILATMKIVDDITIPEIIRINKLVSCLLY